jgi:hypothetical protein
MVQAPGLIRGVNLKSQISNRMTVDNINSLSNFGLVKVRTRITGSQPQNRSRPIAK